MAKVWRLEFLGSLKATWGETEIQRFPTRNAALLLARVSFRLGRMLARDDLTKLLWPEDPVEDARERFRQTLAQLRRTLEIEGAPALLESDRQSVWIRPEIATCDVDTFERLVKTTAFDDSLVIEKLEQAVQLYRGPLLPGWSEEWLIPERESLAARRLQAAKRLAEHYFSQGKAEDALDLAHDAVRDDRLHEAAIQWLLTMLMKMGRETEAQKRFREFRDLLRDQLDMSPSPATEAILENRELLESPVVSEEPKSTAATSQLPTPLTPLIGRDQEVEKITQHLADPRKRLITLTGPGGIGKSRLQLEIGRLMAESTDHRVIFVSLSETRHASEFEPQIRIALGLPEGHPVPSEQIRQALSALPTLMLLDNLEHLAEEIAPRLRRMLEEVSSLTVVGSSRVLLQIPGEQEVLLGPLAGPTPGFDPNPLAAPSVRLLVERIHARLPQMTFDNDQIEALAGLAEFLEGYPLALEIAAARIGLLTPAALLKQLRSRLSLVETRRRDVSSRHHSLRAAIDWSYENLEPETQDLFRMLSIFAGSASLDAVQAVTRDPLALDRLEDLRLHSLIRMEKGIGDKRVRLLETLREYSLDLVSEEEFNEGRERLLDYLVDLSVASAEGVNSQNQTSYRFAILHELENYRSVAHWVIHDRPDLGPKLLRALTDSTPYWIRGGSKRELRSLLDAAINLHTESDQLKALAMHATGRIHALCDDWEKAQVLLDESMRIARELGENTIEADTMATLAVGHRDWGEMEKSFEVAEKTLALRREIGVPLRTLRSLEFLTNLHQTVGDLDSAYKFGLESLKVANEHADSWGQVHSKVYLFAVVLRRKDLEYARQLSQEISSIASMHHEEALMALATEVESDLAYHEGEVELARQLMTQACNLRIKYDDLRGATSALKLCVDLHRECGAWSEALRSQAQLLKIVVREGPFLSLGSDLTVAAEMVFRMGEPSTAASILAARDTALRLLDLQDGPADLDWLEEAKAASGGRWELAHQMGAKWNLVMTLNHIDSVLIRRGSLPS